MRRTPVFALAAALACALAVPAPVHAQVGDLIWEENFNDLSNWLKITGNGSWGWGNGELQYYRNENVDIADTPGEPGNKSLRIVAKQESGPGIVDQWGNPLSYTSGKVMSKSFVSVRYGMIETRVWIPNLDLGGFPAVWLLGTANFAWPACGEIDMMEMGLKKSFRDLHDTHNGGNGLNNSTVNQMTAANAIFYSAGAVTPQNPTGAASLSWDPDDDYCRPYYSHDIPLTGRFVIYRLYWDEDSLRQTVVDGGVERDLFTTPFAIGADADEFHSPFYFIANLAIGGAVTDAYQLGNPASGLPVTMPMPATMYVDYIRVHQWNGRGEVFLGPPTAQGGTFGLFTDNSPTDGGLVMEETAKVYVWEGTLVDGTIAPYEGDHVLAWRTNSKGWFGAGIMSFQPLNLFSFGSGHLHFRIKIPANVTFKIGVIDAWNNQSWVTFPAGQTRYGLVRNGEWGEASIPVTDIRGLAIDLRMLSYSFVILEEQGIGCEFAVDDIYWEGGGAVAAVGPGPAARPRLRVSAAPNPFRDLTELRFDLPDGTAYELEVFDVSGKRVADVSGVSDNGGSTVRWNARDAHGAVLGAGIYFYRLSTSAGSARGRLVRLQ
jgi:beta-glucanase (GH16 family)